jgi:hypothetical protein
MACAAAAFPEVVCFDARILFRGDPRRIWSRILISLAIVAAAGVTAALITAAAAWIVATAISVNLNLHTKASIGLGTAALTDPYRTLGDVADLGEAARIPADFAQAPALTRAAEVQSAALPVSAPMSVPLLLPQPAPESVLRVPPPRSLDGPHVQARQDLARLPADAAAPQVAVAAPPPAAPTAQRPLLPRQARTEANFLPDLDSRTAVYDIAAHTVYLPNGERLEAHSGLGEKLDNPRYVNIKDRGPTPPNVYDLTLREQTFHGVRAIRLNPVDDSKTFGRDGMLAHTYMLGPSGQSFGCVSFKDYPAFLHAFLKGEVDRLVVVPHRTTLAGRGQVATLQESR